MKRRAPDSLPLVLQAITIYAGDQPDLDLLERALAAARHTLRFPGSLEREESRQQFVADECDDDEQIQQIQSDLRVAAQVRFGDAAFMYGLAAAWLLLGGKDGAR